MKKLRLLIVNDSGIRGGGTENRLRLLLEEWLSRSEVERIDVLEFIEGKEEKVRLDGIAIHRIPPDPLLAFRLTKRLIKEKDVNLLQAHNMVCSSPLLILGARKLGVPVVWFVHDYWLLCAKRTFIDPYNARSANLCERAITYRCLKCVGLRAVLRLKFYQQIINKVDIGIAPSNYVKDLFEGHQILQQKWEVVKPWIGLSEFSPTSSVERSQDILFVGSLTGYKGAWVVAEALKYILKEMPSAKLKFLGFQDERDRKKIEAIGERDSTLANMEFLGYRDLDELKSEYQSAGVYVCSPVWPEVFGLTWAEAMACGCPVVASEIGSIPELAGGRAILVPPRDSERLAQAVVGVLKDKEYAERLGEEGRRYVLERFGVNRAVDEVAKIYENLLSKKRQWHR